MFKTKAIAKELAMAFKEKRLIRVPANTELPKPDPIGIGSKILRPVKCYENGNRELINLEPSNTDTGYRVLKASRYVGNPICYYTKHWIATKPSISNSLVCFCSEEIPNDWIYLEVVGMAKNKKSCFVKPVCGTLQDLLQFFNFKKEAVEEVAKEAGV